MRRAARACDERLPGRELGDRSLVALIYRQGVTVPFPDEPKRPDLRATGLAVESALRPVREQTEQT
jgi:hypothetical protein